MKTYWNDLGGLIDEYVDGIVLPYNDFLEEHILKSVIHVVLIDDLRAGFLGVFDHLLTVFFVKDDYFHLADKIFESALETYFISEAFIPTTDGAALSVALKYHKNVGIQALHFSDTGRAVREPEYGEESFLPAAESDLAEIIAVGGDFQDHWEDRVKRGEIYLLKEGGEILGIGVLVGNAIMRNCIGTGMFTREDKRGLGVGRSIILHLKKIAYAMGKTPVPGCWIHNANSRRTLESAGYISKSMLLRIGVAKREPDPEL